MRKTPGRLELHRLKYHWSGKSIPLMDYYSLDIWERKMLMDDVFKQVSMRKIHRDPYSVFIDVISSWGVACPHPQHRRLYREKFFSDYNLDEPWFECTVCGCMVLNTEYSPVQKKIAK